MGPMSLKLFYILLRCSLSPKHDSLMKSNWSHTLLSNNMVPLLTVLVSPKRLISWHHVSYTEERQAGNNHHKKCNYSNLAGFFFDTSNTITINDTHGCLKIGYQKTWCSDGHCIFCGISPSFSDRPTSSVHGLFSYVSNPVSLYIQHC